MKAWIADEIERRMARRRHRRLRFLGCVALLLLAALALSGCGRRWEQFWGQDARRPIEYIPLRPNVLEVEVTGDLFFVMAGKELESARYVNVWVLDGADVAVPLPYYDKVSGKTAMVLRDVKKPEHGPQVLTFIWIRTALPGAVKVRIEYVQ